MSDILPLRAAVRPRVFTAAGDAVLLEDEVARMLDEGSVGPFRLTGDPGSGKTTALQHLAAVFPGENRLRLFDNLIWSSNSTESTLLVICTGAPRYTRMRELQLAPWTEDEVIEYLLTKHKDACKLVMSRLHRDDGRWMNAELWAIVLDRMAWDPETPDVYNALYEHLKHVFAEPELRSLAESISFDALTGFPAPGAALHDLERLELSRPAKRLLSMEISQLLLTSRRVLHALRSSGPCESLSRKLPRQLVKTIGAGLTSDSHGTNHLKTIAGSTPTQQSMAVSLLREAGVPWRPGDGNPPILDGAYLSHVDWPNVRLAGASLKGAELTGANLRGADLTECHAAEVRLDRADLRRARMERFLAFESRLRGADLSGAIANGAAFSYGNLKEAQFTHSSLRDVCFSHSDLRRAVFRSTDLSGAVLLNSRIEGADFTNANLQDAKLSGLPLRKALLTGVNLKNTRLRKCDLEGANLDGVNFESAVLDGSDLTGGSFERANFTGASLQNTGLADVNFEGACLRGADLRDATFHMGSSRSGLLFTPIASEGTRTGFYTDEFTEQHFQAPENVRKANLRFVDLREALVEDVDFYLVDLRGALYDERQEAHFRRCRAILDDWSGDHR